MSRIGVFGGMGPSATVDFLDKLVKLTPAARDQDHLPVIVASLPHIHDRSSAILGHGRDPLPQLLAGIEMLSYSVGPIGGQVRAGFVADLWSVRGAVAAGALVSLAIVAGVAGTIWQARQAQQQRHHQVVADHRGDRDRLDDHHAGRRRQAADEDEQRERTLVDRER